MNFIWEINPAPDESDFYWNGEVEAVTTGEAFDKILRQYPEILNFKELSIYICEKQKWLSKQTIKNSNFVKKNPQQKLI